MPYGHTSIYADDTQFHDSCQPGDIHSLRVRLSRCADDVSAWCKSRRLQLNANKTEAIWFGSQANLASLNSLDCSLRVGLFTVQPSTVVRDLGLHLDNELSMKQHVTKVTATCYYHLHRLRQIWRHVRSEVTTQLVLALVISRLAYCNAALADLPQTTIAPLQRIQNAAARLVFELGPREHVTPCLLQLHWLPVRWRIQFKLCCIMHSVFNGNCPAYLSDTVQTVSASRPHFHLRSSSSTDYVLP